MTTPRTPSPKVRIRSQSFTSPAARVCITPFEESPYSKSSSLVYEGYRAIEKDGGLTEHISLGRHDALSLHTKNSDESIMSSESTASSSSNESPLEDEAELDSCSPSLSPSSTVPREYPHPSTFMQNAAQVHDAEIEPASPFLYRDYNFPMHSPWLVRIVLNLYDVRGLDWMSIAEPVERLWRISTSSAEVLDILSNNGRVSGRRWWD